jgi:hypothetical protein
MAMSEKSVKVLEYMKTVAGQDVTSADVATALGMEKKSVDGVFTSLQKKHLGIRTPAEIELADGSHKKVNFLSLTDAGMTFDPAAESAE